jgi:hypothetical protein
VKLILVSLVPMANTAFTSLYIRWLSWVGNECILFTLQSSWFCSTATSVLHSLSLSW